MSRAKPGDATMDDSICSAELESNAYVNGLAEVYSTLSQPFMPSRSCGRKRAL